MYVVVAIVMTALPYLNGFRGNLVYAFIEGNLVHFVATLVGLLVAVFFKDRIRRKIHRLSLGPAIAPDQVTGADTIAIGVGVALNTMLVTIEVLAIF